MALRIGASTMLRASRPALRPALVRSFAEGPEGIPATLNLNFSAPSAQLYKDFQAKQVRWLQRALPPLARIIVLRVFAAFVG